MRAFLCLVAIAAIVGLVYTNPVAIASSNSLDENLVRREPQIDPPWWATPDIECATTWPEDGGRGPSFTWHNSRIALESVNGFTHAHILIGCECRFWDNLDGKGVPRAAGKSDGKTTDWWGDLHFRAYSIQCNLIGWPIDHRLSPGQIYSKDHTNKMQHDNDGHDLQREETETGVQVDADVLSQTENIQRDVEDSIRKFCGLGYEEKGLNGQWVALKENGYYTVGNLLEWPIKSTLLHGVCKCTFCE
ncbi:hypothetical protein GRF29_112g527988 [Pseudopithomyces chartarum]|uniref:Uncharacterized protein n=1 Tax=Pseudopithomyces chartarum TaxID=1892770 RepID=A0AAN6LRI6_9PLEO|nr:hypothetical protein GRF29_112g527988 [Pseudopithomyces chartarum]